MPSHPPAASDPVEARCNKCRKLTSHTPVPAEAAEAIPALLECSLCHHQRKLPPAASAKKPAPRRPSDPSGEERKAWAALAPGMNSGEALDYSMTSPCKLKSLIKHPLFGLGLVQRVIGPQKVEILFADGKKTMRCK